MDIIVNTFRNRQDTRIILVLWRPAKARFELWSTDTELLGEYPCTMLQTFETDGATQTEWGRAKARATTMARGLSSMNQDQFDAAIRELVPS
jgi:hypothetical protein